MQFKDRIDAGRQLAAKLSQLKLDKPIVYALPRGGVVLGAEIAKALKATLDLVITRKIGYQLNPEYAICAVTEAGDLICNEVERSQADPKWFEATLKEEIAEAKRRRKEYLGRSSISAKGKTAIIVDDGIATGLTMQAAVKQLQSQQPKRLIVAVPVSPKDTAQTLEGMGAEIVALDIPLLYRGAVGAYYDEFAQTTDQEVIDLLKSAETHI